MKITVATECYIHRGADGKLHGRSVAAMMHQRSDRFNQRANGLFFFDAQCALWTVVVRPADRVTEWAWCKWFEKKLLVMEAHIRCEVGRHDFLAYCRDELLPDHSFNIIYRLRQLFAHS